MYVTLEARTPCLLCGFQDRVTMMGSARVNKRSMKVTGPLLGTVGYWQCPECGTTEQGEMRPRTGYRLTAEDAAAVEEYRLRRWPKLAAEAPTGEAA